MKRRLPVVVTVFCSIISVQVSAEIYVQGEVGYTATQTMEAVNYTQTSFGDINARFDIDPATNYGVEAGIEGFEAYDVLRLGLSWQRFKMELDNATGFPGTADPAVPASADKLSALGFEFDNDVELYAANLYYDFPVQMRFKPFMGFSYGEVDMENAVDRERGFMYSLGGRYEITEGFRLGVKYRYANFGNVSDETGLAYQGIQASMYSMTFDVAF